MKKIISVFLAVIIVLCTFFSVTASASGINSTVYFGSYPQNRVENNEIINELNKTELNWVSYDYYIDSQQNNFMKYADVEFNGEKYRAVTFSAYRPYWTTSPSNASRSFQDENNYHPNSIYWFSYEPIEWVMLDPSTGLLMSKMLVDSQPYANLIYSLGGLSYYSDETASYYANNYAESDIREWLNNDFYNTAFSETEKTNIKNPLKANLCYPSFDDYNCATTKDKVFLLSQKDVCNVSYGFINNPDYTDEMKKADGTDYAEIQGLDPNGLWWLRNPSMEGSHVANAVDRDGYVDNRFERRTVYFTSIGVRPAIEIEYSDLKKLSFNSNGANTPVGDIYVPAGTSVKLPSAKKTNAILTGWTDENGNVFDVSENVIVTENKSFTAVWETNNSPYACISAYPASISVEYGKATTVYYKIETNKDLNSLGIGIRFFDNIQSRYPILNIDTGECYVEIRGRNPGNSYIELDVYDLHTGTVYDNVKIDLTVTGKKTFFTMILDIFNDIIFKITDGTWFIY